MSESESVENRCPNEKRTGGCRRTTRSGTPCTHIHLLPASVPGRFRKKKATVE